MTARHAPRWDPAAILDAAAAAILSDATASLEDRRAAHEHLLGAGTDNVDPAVLLAGLCPDCCAQVDRNLGLNDDAALFTAIGLPPPASSSPLEALDTWGAAADRFARAEAAAVRAAKKLDEVEREIELHRANAAANEARRGDKPAAAAPRIEPGEDAVDDAQIEVPAAPRPAPTDAAGWRALALDLVERQRLAPAPPPPAPRRRPA